ELVADQPMQVLLATVGRDPQHRRLFAERTPERARLTAQVPAGLVDIERTSATCLLEQLVIDRLERLGDASEDRVDRADRDRTAEQLLHQLDQLPTRETITDRQPTRSLPPTSDRNSRAAHPPATRRAPCDHSADSRVV